MHRARRHVRGAMVVVGVWFLAEQRVAGPRLWSDMGTDGRNIDYRISQLAQNLKRSVKIPELRSFTRRFVGSRVKSPRFGELRLYVVRTAAPESVARVLRCPATSLQGWHRPVSRPTWSVVQAHGDARHPGHHSADSAATLNWNFLPCSD